MRIFGVLPAGGSGSRMLAQRPKQYLELAGKSLLEHALAALLAEPRIESVLVVVSPGDPHAARLQLPLRSRMLSVAGPTRAHTVRNALDHLVAQGAGEDDRVLVHDAARPCLPPADLAALIDLAAGDASGGLLAAPLADTLKRESAGGDAEPGGGTQALAPSAALRAAPRVAQTVAREGLWRALTPQIFPLGLLRAALAGDAVQWATDEASAVERLGHRPRLVAGSARNLKVTVPDDLEVARALLLAAAAASCTASGAASQESA
jgi:2-C-methyl-D-erythritol 4-phosphate cytidylyltransferase